MITTGIIQKYISANANAELVNASLSVRYHSDGILPDGILNTLRPNEPNSVKEYRKKIYKPKTRGAFGKVFTLLKKIQKAPDFTIRWNEQIGTIPENENLKNYIELNYPYRDSLMNYVFDILLKDIIVDANAVCLVMPQSFDVKEYEYKKPFPFVFKSENVLEFIENELCVLRIENGKYIFVDREELVFVEIKNRKVNQQKYTFSFKEMPAFKLGGRIKKFESGRTIYESFIVDALPSWDEAMRLYSDHQANLALHIHPEKWMYENNECLICKGTGKLPNEYGELVPCNTLKKCNGTGYNGNSPFGIHLVNPGNAMENQVPTPPIGYVNKPIELVTLLREEIEKQINEGFDALGLSFLSEIGANQSGIAKEYDRDEANSFLHEIAYHLVNNIINPIIWFTNEWRYPLVTQRKENLPIIKVPTEFDSITNRIVSERLKNAITSKYDYSTRLNLQIQYAKKEFGELSQDWQIIETIGKLNPLPDKTDEEKMVVLSNRGCTMVDYVLSCNINSFVYQCVANVDNFLLLSMDKKRTILIEMAKKIIEENKKSIINLNESNG